MVRISRQGFERLVVKALEGLPPSIRERLNNVDVVVKDLPGSADLEENSIADPYELFGLYEGIPLTERAGYDMVLPDKITIYRRSIEAACDTRAAVVREVRATVIHEVAHHFGIGDAELEETEYG